MMPASVSRSVSSPIRSPRLGFLSWKRHRGTVTVRCDVVSAGQGVTTERCEQGGLVNHPVLWDGGRLASGVGWRGGVSVRCIRRPYATVGVRTSDGGVRLWSGF